MAQQTQEQDINHLLKVRREKLAELQQNGRDPFQITKFDQTHHSLEVKGLYEAHESELLKDRQEPNVEGMDEEQAKEALKKDYEERRNIMDASPIHVAIAGRMMFKRVMGKASFCNIQDLQGNIQVYVARDAIGTESYADFKKSDIGDIFGVEGFAFRTRTGEISIHAEKVTLLSKSLQILPEKFHGLTDVDTRYRQRYVDLIMNTESKDTFIKRSKILSAIRKYLSGEGFMEVETPMLVQNAGGAAARPFETHFNALNEDLKLRISLELYLKRLIVGGLEKVYEIGRVFRNEGLDTRHNPEFTLMELYQAFTDYHGMMDLTENAFNLWRITIVDKAVIYIHGKGGNAEEAIHYKPLFSNCDVIGLDYTAQFPWEAKEEFPLLFNSIYRNYKTVEVIANSIGAYFAINALSNQQIEKAYFISPVVNTFYYEKWRALVSYG